MQEGWCDSVGSVEEIQAKLLKRQEAAAKRERAMAYALAHQVILQTIKLMLILWQEFLVGGLGLGGCPGFACYATQKDWRHVLWLIG